MNALSGFLMWCILSCCKPAFFARPPPLMPEVAAGLFCPTERPIRPSFPDGPELKMGPGEYGPQMPSTAPGGDKMPPYRGIELK